MTAVISQFVADEDGATAIEYGLIAALMGVALIAAFILFGTSLVALFDYVKTNAQNAMGG
jgi:pilus assembly protein Flp/PilA